MLFVSAINSKYLSASVYIKSISDIQHRYLQACSLNNAEYEIYKMASLVSFFSLWYPLEIPLGFYTLLALG